MRVAFWIALAEGLLAVTGVIPKWLVFVLAVVAIAFWWFTGRRHRYDAARQASWIFATSQALVVLIPAALLVLGTIAVVITVLIAIAALILLFTERT
jgi:cbb3-type cytochrome oxidase subunit 3